MDIVKEKKSVFQLVCPYCESVLWVNSLTQRMIKQERKKKEMKDSLEDLLLKEKKRKEGFERKFEASAEMDKKKLEKAKEKFAKALSDFKEED